MHLKSDALAIRQGSSIRLPICSKARRVCRALPPSAAGVNQQPGHAPSQQPAPVTAPPAAARSPLLARPKPVIILVNPIMPENIGSVARAMKNFGLKELRLVAPKDGWTVGAPSPFALTTASHAADVLQSAQLYATTEDAIADLHTVYASTARSRAMNKPVVLSRDLYWDYWDGGQLGVWSMVQQQQQQQHSTDSTQEVTSGTPGSQYHQAGQGAAQSHMREQHQPEQQQEQGQEQQQLQQQAGALDGVATGPHQQAGALNGAATGLLPVRVGILFGRESSGLSNADVALANKVVTVDSDPSYPVMNLSQAVTVVVYDLYQEYKRHLQSLQQLQEASPPPFQEHVSWQAVHRFPALPTTSYPPAVTTSAANSTTSTTTTTAAATVAPQAAAGPMANVQQLATATGDPQAGAPPMANVQQLATKGELEVFVGVLFRELEAARFFESDAAKTEGVQLHIRNLLGRIEALSVQDLRLMHGMLAKLTRYRNQREGSAPPPQPTRSYLGE